jgi:hypothetical protein
MSASKTNGSTTPAWLIASRQERSEAFLSNGMDQHEADDGSRSCPTSRPTCLRRSREGLATNCHSIAAAFVQFHDAGGERKQFRKLLANESND